MPDNRVLIEIIGKDEASGVLKGVEKGLGDLDKTTQKSASAQSEALGMNRREWTRMGSESIYYLQSIGGHAGVLTGTLGTLAGAATQVGESLMFGGPQGVVLAVAAAGIGAVAAAAQRERQAYQDAIKPSQDLKKGIDDLSGAHDALGKLIATVFNLTGQEADIVAKAAENYSILEGPTRKVADLREGMIEQGNRYKDTELELKGYLGSGMITQEMYNKLLADAQQPLKDTTNQFVALTGNIVKQAGALNESGRILGVYKSSLPGARAEMESFGQAAAAAAREHKKAQAGFAYDWSEVERKAAESRIEIKQQAAEQITGIHENMLQQIGDLESSHLGQETEQYYSYSKSIREMDRDRLQAAKDDAKDRLAIEKNLANELKGINRDEADKEASAKTYAEVLRIRRDADERRKEAQDKAKEARVELKDKIDARKEEFQHRRALLDEDYNHSKDLADKSLRDSIQRSQRQADAQIAKAEEAEAKQMAALQKRVGEERGAIAKRKADEESAYAASAASSKTAHDQTIANFKDTRTEAEKTRDTLMYMEQHGWKIDVEFRNRIIGEAGPSNWGAPPRARGGPVTAGQAYMVGERGPELFVPRASGQIQPRGAGGITLNVGNIYGVADLQRTIWNALDLYNRGLTPGGL